MGLTWLFYNIRSPSRRHRNRHRSVTKRRLARHVLVVASKLSLVLTSTQGVDGAPHGQGIAYKHRVPLYILHIGLALEAVLSSYPLQDLTDQWQERDGAGIARVCPLSLLVHVTPPQAWPRVALQALTK